MNQQKTLQLRAIEIRKRLNELGGKDDLNDEETAEVETLSKEYRTVETRQAALLLGEEPGEGEQVKEEPTETRSEADKKLLELRSKVSIGNYVSAALEERHVDGAEAEFNAELKMRSAGGFPLELLAPVEVRATTDADSQTTQKRWLDRLFAETAAMSLGVTMESVEPGVASYPVTTAGASAAQRGRREAAADAAWTVGVSEIKPTRNAVRAVFSEEDAMRLPGLEEALRRDLGMALTEGVDRAIFVGDGDANENAGDIAGLTTLANVIEKEITQANKIKGPESLQAFVELVDGIHATGVVDLNCVLAVGAHTLWGTTLANAAAENDTILQFLKENGLSCTVRGGIEDATAAGDFGAFVGRGRGLAGAGVAAIWNSGMLIRDPYSGASKGEVALTLSYFWGFKLPRPSNFARVKFVA